MLRAITILIMTYEALFERDGRALSIRLPLALIMPRPLHLILNVTFREVASAPAC